MLFSIINKEEYNMKWIRKLKELLKKRKEERPIVLDTCALETKQAMEIIEKASKVILLTGILDEMDKYKKEYGMLGINIREVLRKSREDKDSEKYVCVAGYDKHSYNDKNIIDYCRKHRRTIIVTADNNVCNYAKAYKIDYIFVEDVKKSHTKTQHEKSPKKEKVIGQNVKGVIYKGGKLYMTENKKNINFLVFRDGKNIKDDSNKQIEIQEGDFIYMLKKDENEISVTHYEVLRISQHNYAKQIYSNLLHYSDTDSKKVESFPKEVKEQLLIMFNKSKETKSKDLYFYNHWINPKRSKDYSVEVKLERDGKLINIQDYQEGDFIYLLKHNNTSKHIQVAIYKIINEDGNYEAEEIEQNQIYYINQIYRLDISAELQEAIREFFITKIKY